MCRNHLDGRIANKVTAFMTKEHAGATRGDMVEAIQSGTGEIFSEMTCHMKTIPDSDAFLLDMKDQAVAVHRSLLLIGQRMPILFSTTSAAEQCSLFTQLGLELLSNPPGPARDRLACSTQTSAATGPAALSGPALTPWTF